MMRLWKFLPWVEVAMAVKFELAVTQKLTAVAVLCSLVCAVVISTLRQQGGMSLLPGGTLRLVHLGAFSTWLGVQVWVTFFAGE